MVKVQIAITELNNEDVTFYIQNKTTQHIICSMYGERKWAGETEREREREKQREREQRERESKNTCNI